MIPPAPIAPQSNVPVHYVKSETGEIIRLENVKLRVLEDGTGTGTAMTYYATTPVPRKN